MPLAGIVTVVLAIVIALAVASYLVRVVLILNAVNDTLGKVTFGVRAIAHQTAPLGELLTPIKADLEAVADTLESVAAGLDRSSVA
ncbi:MAG: hypothetical protein HKN44_16145 [Ilumatobacter sp.]|nr:hypothetical protein [Ilumatobacter sp.]